jgi:hypothetical protein
VVEKVSNVLWTHEELLEARDAGQYQEAGQLLPPDGHMDVSAPFPGCMQMGGGRPQSEAYHAVAQTEHFVIFAAPTPATAAR